MRLGEVREVTARLGGVGEATLERAADDRFVGRWLESRVGVALREVGFAAGGVIVGSKAAALGDGCSCPRRCLGVDDNAVCVVFS